MLTLLNSLLFCSLSRLSIFLIGGRYNSSKAKEHSEYSVISVVKPVPDTSVWPIHNVVDARWDAVLKMNKIRKQKRFTFL